MLMARPSTTPSQPNEQTTGRLTAAARAEAEQASRRLHEELRPLIGALPDSERGASAMSRLLSVDRAVCQRLVYTLSKGEPDVRSLVDFPGPDGLRSIIQALTRRRLADAATLAGAKAAVDRYEEVLKAVAGSQRKLKQLLDEESPVVIAGRAANGLADPTLNARRRLFNPAAEITGRWTETLMSMRFIRYVNTPVSTRESVTLRAYLGHVANRDAIAMETGESSLNAAPGKELGFKTLAQLPASGSTPGILLPEFCSEPLPRVVSQSDESVATHVIDLPESQLGKPTNIVIAARDSREEPHPATWRPPIAEVSIMNLFPSRRLVYDVFLHRELASRCLPSASAHLTTPGHMLGGVSRWTTRLQGRISLQLLGVGVGNTHNDAYPRQQELVGHVYSQLGWDPNDFVGYRMEVNSPVWRAQYVMRFDFTGNELPAQEGGSTIAASAH